MTIKSRMITFGATAIITLTLVGNSFAEITPFSDLENINGKDKILALQEVGYVKGMGDGIFAPYKAMSAAEGIQLIVNALELNLDLVRFIKEPKATDYFVKADNSAWYAEALIIAAVNGLEFSSDLSPDQEWTQEEFTYHLIQAMEVHRNLPVIKLIGVDIADEDQITVGYSGAIQRALVYGVAKLDAERKFNPKAIISRADAAEQVYNALEYIKTHSAPDVNGESVITE